MVPIFLGLLIFISSTIHLYTRPLIEQLYRYYVPLPPPNTWADYLDELNLISLRAVSVTVIMFIVMQGLLYFGPDEWRYGPPVDPELLHGHYHFTGYSKFKFPPSDGEIYGFTRAPETKVINNDDPFGVKSREFTLVTTKKKN